MFSLFILLSLPLLSASTSPPYPYGNVSYHIDCNGHTVAVDSFNTTWLLDRFFTDRAAAVVSKPLHFRQHQEKTLCHFPLSADMKNCYIVLDLSPGRYYVGTFTTYNNYDGKSRSPSFDTSVEGDGRVVRARRGVQEGDRRMRG